MENQEQEQKKDLENENEELKIEDQPIKKGEKRVKIIEDGGGDEDPFSGLDLGDFSEKAPPKDSQKGTQSSDVEKSPLGEDSIEKGTTMVVLLFDLLNSKLCGWFSGNDSGTYRLTKSEKNEIVESATAYFKTINFEASPLGVFGLTVLTIMLSKWITVYRDYDKNKKAKKVYKIQPKVVERKEDESEKSEVIRETKIVEFRPDLYKKEEPPKPKTLSDLESEIIKNLDSANFVEKTNKRGKFQFYTTGKYKGFYEFSTTGKRYACDAAKEHLKEENNQPTAVIMKQYELLLEFLGNDKEAQSKLGKLVRKVKNVLE